MKPPSIGVLRRLQPLEEAAEAAPRSPSRRNRRLPISHFVFVARSAKADLVCSLRSHLEVADRALSKLLPARLLFQRGGNSRLHARHRIGKRP